MARKKTPGLFQRGEIWHIDKHIEGRRIRESTGTSDLAEAERYLGKLIDQARRQARYGERLRHTFDEAAAKFVLEHQHKRSIDDDIERLGLLVDMLGDQELTHIHMGTLQPYIERRKRDGVTVGTINHGLKIVRRILNLAAGEWIDGSGKTWLASAAKIKLLADDDKRPPYPLSWEEQTRLFQALPAHLADMALFAVNTGARVGEICALRWAWEAAVPDLNTSVFIIPGANVKNKDDRLIVLNDIARAVIESRRGRHPERVFTYRGHGIRQMTNTAWRQARERAGLPQVRVHDLKHTFGRRLRAAGVDFETRQDLLGHRSGRITTHYSAPELGALVDAANRVVNAGDRKPDLAIIRRLNVG